MPVLDPLPAVRVRALEVVSVPMRLTRPLASAAGRDDHRDVLLVHVRADEADGWAECAVLPSPTYSAEFTVGARLVLLDHLLPRAWAGPTGDARALGPALRAVRGHETARAAVELAVLDAQLRAADRSLAGWLGGTADVVAAGAALGLHADVDDLLAEADAALSAGATRLRVKIAPGRAIAHLRALRAHVGPDLVLQADANGSFAGRATDAELQELDDVDLACLEQPLDPADLLGHARLADRLRTPICLDEPMTSLGAVDAAVALGACEVVCLKPARIGSWVDAVAVHDRCLELDVPVWIGGLLETGVGRAANAAFASRRGLAFAPDLDPRGRFDPDLADPLLPTDGGVPVPTGPGTGAHPDAHRLAGAEVVEVPAP